MYDFGNDLVRAYESSFDDRISRGEAALAAEELRDIVADREEQVNEMQAELSKLDEELCDIHEMLTRLCGDDPCFDL